MSGALLARGSGAAAEGSPYSPQRPLFVFQLERWTAVHAGMVKLPEKPHSPIPLTLT